MNQNQSQNKSPSMETAFYITGWCGIGLVAAVALFVRISGVDLNQLLLPCAFHTFTGLYCPGCGGTRAVTFLLHGDSIRSLIYHPFVIYGGVLCLWFMVSQTIERLSAHRIAIGMKYRDIYLWAAMILVLLNFVVKNVLLIFWKIDLLTF